MSAKIDLRTWFDGAEAVATAVPAGALFSFLKRSFTVPTGFVALTRGPAGTPRLHPSGQEITDDAAGEVLFAREQAVELALTVAQVPAADRYLCDGTVNLRVRVLADRHELEAFRERVLGSAAALKIEGLARYLQPAVGETLRAFARKHAAADLVDAKVSAEGEAAVAQAVQELCFSGGLALEGPPRIQFSSASLARARESAEQAARRLHEHRAHEELHAAIAAAQQERLAHLEAMLARLKSLADASPEIELPQLMRAFDESQRGQLYDALFRSQASRRVTQWIVVVAGTEVLFFDSQAPADPARRVALDGPAGALRSVQFAGCDGRSRLLVGAARGVYVVDVEDTAATEAYLFEASEGVRGGVNAVALSGENVVATHSEGGVLLWRRGRSELSDVLLGDLTAPAQAVRCAQFAQGRFWCSIDAEIVSLPAADLHARPEIRSCPGVVTALCACATGVYAGTADGEVVCWDDSPDAPPQRLHAGSRRPAESVHLLEAGGATRLFFTDTSLAVFARVVGDTFACRYEAGGQTIRRAEVAADVLAGVNDPRDRVIVWSSDQPAKPIHVIPVSRLTGRSVQDVCLV